MRLKRAWVVWAVVTWLAASTLWAAEIPSARPEEVGLSSARLAEMQAVAHGPPGMRQNVAASASACFHLTPKVEAKY